MTGYGESGSVSTDSEETPDAFLHPGRKRERENLSKTGHVSVWLRADPNQGSCPVTSRRLSQSPSKLNIKALRDTVPLTREQSTERLIIIHTVS